MAATPSSLSSGASSRSRRPSNVNLIFVDAMRSSSKEYRIHRVRIGTIDGDPGSRAIAHIFVGSEAAWDVIPDDGLERFEEHAPTGDVYCRDAVANATLTEIHDRMPVVLDERAAEDWMNLRERDPLSLKRLLVPAPDDLLVTSPASPLVNSVKNDGPEPLTAPVHLL
jgi:hypothetical protein